MAKPSPYANRPKKPDKALLETVKAELALAPSSANVHAVREQLAAARRWLTDVTQIRRLDIVEGIIDGIEMARMLGDPGNVIKGWVEVGKLLGYAAPEVKTVNLTINQMNLRQKFEGMSLEQLLAIAEGTSQDDITTVVPHEEAFHGS